MHAARFMQGSGQFREGRAVARQAELPSSALRQETTSRSRCSRRIDQGVPCMTEREPEVFVICPTTSLANLQLGDTTSWEILSRLQFWW